MRDHIDPDALQKLKTDFRKTFRIVKPFMIVVLLIASLHYAPVLSAKYKARQLLDENLERAYQPGWRFKVVRSSDYSNYWGVFDGRNFIPSGGYEEWWSFCLLVEASAPGIASKMEAFSAGGDRANNEMDVRRVESYGQCLERQVG
jgi:hypothetical protein